MSTSLIVIEPPATLPAAIQAELDIARAFALAEKAPRTREAYRADFRHFVGWCGERGLSCMPATPETACAYFGSLATAGMKASTIGRRAAALRHAHRLAGHEPPTALETVRATLRGIRREIGTAPDRKAACTADRLTAMLAHVPDTLTGKRDRALILLGFAGALRRSELVALTVADLADAPDGLRVLIRHSKTDQEGQGATIAVPNGSRLRPVAAVKAWLGAAGIESGPVFRQIGRGDRIGAEALSAQTVTKLVKAYAGRAGLDPAAFGAHSLRSGFLTAGAEAGASIWKLQEVSRHKSVDVLSGYIRRADLFKEHAGAAFL